MSTPAAETERLIDAIAFAFVSVAVHELGVRPTPTAIERFRQRVAAALERDARGPVGMGDEPTEPRTSRSRKPR